MLNPVNRRILIKKLRKIGFIGPFSATRHEYMKRSNQKIFIPNPHRKDIGVPLLKRIIKQVGISEKNFKEL